VKTLPVIFFDGALDHRDAPHRWQLRAGFERDLLYRAALSARERRQGKPIVVDDEQAAVAAARFEQRQADRVGVHQFVTDAYYDKKQRGPWQHSAPHRGSVISVC